MDHHHVFICLHRLCVEGEVLGTTEDQPESDSGSALGRENDAKAENAGTSLSKN